MIRDKRYLEHHVFAELDRYIDFYDFLAHSVVVFIPAGTTMIGNFNSFCLTSIHGTLSSIRSVLRDGHINDAYALLRKYYDFITINIYSNLCLKDGVEEGKWIVDEVDNWLKDTEKLPAYRAMWDYIRSSKHLADITELTCFDCRYQDIRERCNDHVHCNRFSSALLNDDRIYFEGRLDVLNTFSSDVADLFILHLAYLFSINQHYMASSDYVDALECGLTPEPDSQYWVARLVQEVFDEIIAVRRPDLAAAIKKRTDMHLK